MGRGRPRSRADCKQVTLYWLIVVGDGGGEVRWVVQHRLQYSWGHAEVNLKLHDKGSPHRLYTRADNNSLLHKGWQQPIVCIYTKADNTTYSQLYKGWQQPIVCNTKADNSL